MKCPECRENLEIGARYCNKCCAIFPKPLGQEDKKNIIEERYDLNNFMINTEENYPKNNDENDEYVNYNHIEESADYDEEEYDDKEYEIEQTQKHKYELHDVLKKELEKRKETDIEIEKNEKEINKKNHIKYICYTLSATIPFMGFILFFILRKKNPKIAKNCIYISIIITFILNKINM